MAFFTKKIIITIGCIVVLLAIALGTALPLTVFKSKNKNDNTAWKGSDVLDEVPLCDTHNDFPYNLYAVENNQLENFQFDSNLKINPRWQIDSSHTDLARIREGKLGAQFWVAWVTCTRNYKDAVERTLEQIDVIKRFVKKYPKDLMFATSHDEIMEAFKQGKVASLIEVEGGHSIDSRMSVLRLFYELGVRCMTLTHNCNVPWADNNQIDSNPDAPKKNLTNWGKKVIKEMNRLGMIVDISHVSEGVMRDVLDVSEAPVIFSHSSVYTLRNHVRNVKDDVLLKLKENNGVIMINFYSHFISTTRATIYDVANHINYVRELIGVEHVGIGSDFDGIELAPIGLEDSSKYPALFDLLAEEGHDWKPWTPEELKKLAGENFLKAFKAIEDVRDKMKDMPMIDEPVPYEDVVADNNNAGDCRTDLNKYKPVDPQVQEVKVKRMLDVLDYPEVPMFLD